jgi:hypothetical protein
MSDAKSEPPIAKVDDESESGDLIFDTLWNRVLEAWDDDKTHGALLEYALRKEQLPAAAGRYRALVDDPEKGPKAKKRLDAIVLAAMQLMQSFKTPPRPKLPWWVTVLVVCMCFLALAWVASVVLTAHRRG